MDIICISDASVVLQTSCTLEIKKLFFLSLIIFIFPVQVLKKLINILFLLNIIWLKQINVDVEIVKAQSVGTISMAYKYLTARSSCDIKSWGIWVQSSILKFNSTEHNILRCCNILAFKKCPLSEINAHYCCPIKLSATPKRVTKYRVELIFYILN